jgi:(p)ppGpp synthase/HD superfamily hydrolase
MESFKLNLYQDEIYVFTPKGDLKILPQNSTPIDFAFEIHSNVGYHCIGAKVNGRIVPLSTVLRSGDQVEIISSKNQTPNAGWEQFAVTHKAKSHIRRFIREESRKLADEGRDIWEKKIKRRKITISKEEFEKFIHSLKYADIQAFYYAIVSQTIDVDTTIEQYVVRLKHPAAEDVVQMPDSNSLFSKFINTARDLTSGISILGVNDNFLHQYAKCCNPIPGDPIVGFVTTVEGIKIHRKDCKNILSLRLAESERIVEVTWPSEHNTDYITGIHISGEDRPGLLSDITHAISTYQNTNIRTVNVDSHGSAFDGKFVLYVKDTDHLARIIEKIKNVSGIQNVERFSGKGD